MLLLIFGEEVEQLSYICIRSIISFVFLFFLNIYNMI